MLLLLATGVSAAQLRSLQVAEHDGVYRVTAAARLDASPQAVFAVLTDYAHLKRLNPSILSVRVLDSQPSGAGHVVTRIHLCVWAFCKTLQQEQVMSVPRPWVLHTRIVPAGSEFRSGEADWRLVDCDGATCLDIDASIQPDFWVPPLIGPWVIRRGLRDEAVQTITNLERLARQRPVASGR